MQAVKSRRQLCKLVWQLRDPGKEKHRTEERSESTSGVRRKFGYAENEDPRRAAIVEGLCTNRVSVFGSVRLAAD